MFSASEQVWAKVRRAYECRDQWDAVLDTWLDQEPYDFHWEYDRRTRWHSLILHERVPPPIELAVVFADEIGNLRAALDMAICLIVGEARCDRGTRFPVVTDRKDWQSAVVGNLHDFPTGFIGAVESFQPFNDRNGPNQHPLRILDYANNRYKHRVLIPIRLGSFEASAALKFSRSLGPHDLVMRDRTLGGGEFKDGATVMRLRVLTKDQQLKVIAYPDVIQVHAGWGPNTGLSVGRLPNLKVFVGSILEALAPVL